MCYIKYCQCAAIAKLQNVLKVVHHSGSWICGCSQALMIGGLPLKSAYERPGLLVSSIRPVYANLALAPSSHSVALSSPRGRHGLYLPLPSPNLRGTASIAMSFAPQMFSLPPDELLTFVTSTYQCPHAVAAV